MAPLLIAYAHPVVCCRRMTVADLDADVSDIPRCCEECIAQCRFVRKDGRDLETIFVEDMGHVRGSETVAEAMAKDAKLLHQYVAENEEFVITPDGQLHPQDNETLAYLQAFDPYAPNALEVLETVGFPVFTHVFNLANGE